MQGNPRTTVTTESTVQSEREESVLARATIAVMTHHDQHQRGAERAHFIHSSI